MIKERKYPIGIQSFADIRQEGYVYIDKTAYVYQMTHAAKYNFLSRPRRFGKSLLVSTLQAYFEGRKELFHGLAIEQMEQEWTPYPVLHIDFSTSKFYSIEELTGYIDDMLEGYERVYGASKEGQPFSIRFKNIISRAYEQTGRKVVVLIDEYDSPLFDSMEDDKLQRQIRSIVKGLLSPLKAQGSLIQFLFITGITKFSQMSVFSELNNLRNISLLNEYAGICGITEQELSEVFREDIAQLAESQQQTYHEAMTKLKQRYDGYHFTAESPDIYNPFSLLNVFADRQYGSYWFSTGTPTFLISLLQKRKLGLGDLEQIETTEDRFDQSVEQVSDPVPVLYQSGYLTLKNYNKENGLYTLGLPNAEVRTGFATSLYSYYAAEYPEGKDWLYGAYLKLKANDDITEFMEALKTFYAGIPFDLNNQNEMHYHALFYTLLVAYGADVQAQVRSAKGMADIVLKTPRTIYVFELKYNHSATEALSQIKDRGYADVYLKDSRRVVCVGVSFSSKMRNISEYKIIVVK